MDQDPTAAIAGIGNDSGLARVLEGRADIMALTRQTHDAALTPADPGGLSHAERAALACRLARINRDADFEAHFRALMEKAGAADTTARMADTRFDGDGDRRLNALLRHVDLVALAPRNATRRDVELLREAGLSDGDVVRLSELVAFVSYQLRVAAGLRLMRGLA